MTNYYQILAIEATVDAAAVKAAIMRQLRTWSGRTSSHSLERRQEAEKMMKLIAEAEAVLSDSDRRKNYDRELTSSPAPAASPSSSGGRPASTSSAGELVAEGRQRASEGRYEEALELATRATELQGDHAEAWALLAAVHHHLGEKQQAIFEYGRALRQAPDNAAWHFEVGLVHEALTEYDRAIEHYQTAARIDPQETVYRAEIGLVYYLKDDLAEAVSIWEDCLRTDPNNKSVKDLMCDALIQQELAGFWDIPAGTGIPAGYYAASRSQVDSAKAAIAKVRQQGSPGPRLGESIARLESFLAASETMYFQGSKRILIAAAAMSVLGWMWAGGFTHLTYQLWYLGGGLLYFFASRLPGYAVVASRLQQQAGKTSLGVHLADSGSGCLLSLAFVALPVIAIITYVRNQKLIRS